VAYHKVTRILAVIPARGGSKAIRRKNVKPLNGKPLIYYTLEEALKSKHINRVIVSTEDKEIAQTARACGAEVIERPLELAQDDTPALSVYQHVISYLERMENFYPSIVVALNPTSPCRLVEDIDQAIEKLLDTNCDSVVSVCEVEHPPHWMYSIEGDRLNPIIKGGERLTRRQDAPNIYRLNGAIYVTYRDVIMEHNRVMGNDTRPFIMPLERSIDIDNDLDFRLAELQIRRGADSQEKS